MGRAGDGFEPATVQAQMTLEIQQWLRGETNLSATDRADIPKQRVRLSPGGAGIAALRDYYSKGDSDFRVLDVLLHKGADACKCHRPQG